MIRARMGEGKGPRFSVVTCCRKRCFVLGQLSRPLRRGLSTFSAEQRKARSGLSGRVCAVLGSQWGDEGKGKLVDILAKKYVAGLELCICWGLQLLAGGVCGHPVP